MSQPYVEFEDTPLWRAIDAALTSLEENHDVAPMTARTHVVGYLCRQLHDAGVLAPAAMEDPRRAAQRFASFLDGAADAWPGDAAWQATVGVAHESAIIEQARQQAALTQLRLAQGSLTPEQAAGYLRAIARGLRERAG